ncbi:MAG TPA: hypothetical protein PLL30_08385 [Candidatus Krumholzibacteria bacterium]|nr:hypothetical protein [Candidatus Krumholzibacteria bacterium]HPD71775.1 hypothetical protein [Candidatus Krumholzibacteria bacterium]HRY41292.1 hypothetical protein [Candidatus Krumholzibacteria bacterium]
MVTRHLRTARPPSRLLEPGAGDPEVLLDVEYERGCLYLVLANVGWVTAFDVRVEFRQPLRGAGGDVDIAALAVFRKLPLLRSGKEIRVFVDVARDLLARRGPKLVRAEVSYRGRDRKRLGETFTHDLRIWRDWGDALVRD